MSHKFQKGFVHGRFQIFHKEHLVYVLAAKKYCDQLIVGITSPDPSISPYEEVAPHRSEQNENPFTFYERLEIIKVALVEAGLSLSDFNIVPLPIGKPELIKNYIPKDAVSFFTIYDEWGKEKVKRISEMGYQTIILWDNRPKGISGTKIRNEILNNGDWKKYVPLSVYDFIINTGLVNRITQKTYIV